MQCGGSGPPSGWSKNTGWGALSLDCIGMAGRFVYIIRERAGVHDDQTEDDMI